MMPNLLALLFTLIMVTQVVAGIWTSNNFFYKPDVGARGAQEKTIFDSALDRVDTRLGNEHWLNDPAFGGNLQAAIAAIGTTTTVLNIPSGTWPIASNLTIPANITLKLVRGAILNIVTGKTLTINGTLEAGLYQIFSCTGTGKVVLKGVRYPQWWGAVGDGAADDYAPIQAALTSIVDSGVNGTVRLSPRSVSPLGYKIGTGLTIDAHLVNLIGNGALINADNIADGTTALTITGSVSEDGNVVNRIGGFILNGPSISGACYGIKFTTPSLPGNSARTTLYNTQVSGFGIGISLQDRAYINSFYDVEAVGNGIGIELPTGFTDYGENIRWFGGGFYSNTLAVKSYCTAADIYFYGTSFDFNTKYFAIDGSHVQLFGCHIEHGDVDDTLIDVTGNGGLFYMHGGEVLLKSGGDGILTGNYVASCDVGAIILDGVFLVKCQTATGRFATGTGYVAIKNSSSYSGGYLPAFTSEAMTALSDGSFETGVFQDNLFLTYDSAAITSRTNGTNIDLVISDVYARTGANALRITVGGAGGAKRAGLAIPIQPGQYGNCEFYYKKAGAQTGTMYTTHTFARLETDANGVPVVKKLMWPPCANNEIVFAADPVDWTKNTSQKTTNVRAPAWATHYVVEIALDGVNAGDLYFDDFVMTVQ